MLYTVGHTHTEPVRLSPADHERRLRVCWGLHPGGPAPHAVHPGLQFLPLCARLRLPLPLPRLAQCADGVLHQISWPRPRLCPGACDASWLSRVCLEGLVGLCLERMSRQRWWRSVQLQLRTQNVCCWIPELRGFTIYGCTQSHMCDMWRWMYTKSHGIQCSWRCSVNVCVRTCVVSVQCTACTTVAIEIMYITKLFTQLDTLSLPLMVRALLA